MYTCRATNSADVDAVSYGQGSQYIYEVIKKGKRCDKLHPQRREMSSL
jgi:hypothetical protein